MNPEEDDRHRLAVLDTLREEFPDAKGVVVVTLNPNDSVTYTTSMPLMATASTLDAAVLHICGKRLGK